MLKDSWKPLVDRITVMKPAEGTISMTAADSDEIGRMVITNRFTGEVIGEGAAISAADMPFQSPHPNVVIWRYLDRFKFEDIVRNRRLYFRRSDHLDDEMEGRFSEANRRFQTSLWKRFHEAYPIRDDPEQQRQINESIRHRVFLNCWHINAHESARMWNLYYEISRFGRYPFALWAAGFKY